LRATIAETGRSQKLTLDRINERALPSPRIPARVLQGASLLLALFTNMEAPGHIDIARFRIQVREVRIIPGVACCRVVSIIVTARLDHDMSWS
jgi:hypothetical protein